MSNYFMRLTRFFLNLFFVLFLSSGICLAALMTREEFLEAIKGSYGTEMGSFGTTTGDEKKLGEYICANWRSILKEYKSLSLIKTDSIHGLHHLIMAYACEELPPFEYLDFLDEMLNVIEQMKVNNEPLDYANLLFYGRGRKDSFLAVNWEHPRVKKILQRAIKFFSEVDPTAVDCLQSEAKGELAENYMSDRRDGDPLPETLPGIKLIRPWGSLLKKYELFTGKKLPPDPSFPDNSATRANRRNHTSSQSGDQGAVLVESWSAWIWAGIAGAICLTVLAHKLFIGRKRH
jgi:hypothetical protein